MRRIIAIALIAARSAVRSRLFLLLMLILLVTVIGLPLSIKGDGTVAGRIGLVVYYTLALSAVVLGAATLWTSCAAVSLEIEEKQIHLVMTKPVRGYQVWLGKWLGLVAMNTVLLLVVGAVMAGLIRWDTRRSHIGPEAADTLGREILVGREVVAPQPEAIEDAVQEHWEQLSSDDRIPHGTTREEAMDRIRRRIRHSRATVPPGAAREWRIHLRPGLTDGLQHHGKQVMVRFHCSSGSRLRSPVSGSWEIGPDGLGTPYSTRTEHVLAGHRAFPVPLSAITGEGDGPPAAGRTADLVVRFINDPRDKSTTAVFDTDRPLELLMPRTGFEVNLVSALLVLLCYLAFLAALGLTAGTLFSFPVATFAAAAVLTIFLLTHCFAVVSAPGAGHHGHAHEEAHGEPSLLCVAGERMIKKLGVVVAPAMRFAPLARVSDGILLGPRFVGGAALVLGLLYPGALAVLAGIILSRRELGLPT